MLQSGQYLTLRENANTQKSTQKNKKENSRTAAKSKYGGQLSSGAIG
jgi:hypothetical protein